MSSPEFDRPPSPQDYRVIYAGQTDGNGSGSLTSRTIFSFPFEYWFTGQFLIVWFILICFLFNLMVDRLTERYRQRRQQW